ncbi:MAG: hypothetical protein K6A44_04120 [bacterium]|nr:hypothetical protein [bacterium]
MEIDKILFGRLAETTGTDRSFEDLDVNNDGVIDEEDAAVANQSIAAEITNLLNSVDEEAELSLDADFDINNLSKASAADSSNSATAADSTSGMSKEEYQKSITKYTYSGLGSDGKLRKEMENNQGVSFVLMTLVGVSVEHCGSGVSSFVNVTNDKNCILDTMYDLKDYANFKYVQTKAVPSVFGGSSQNKPCIVKYVDGKVAETIWLEPEQANAEGIKNIFMSQLGLTADGVNNTSQAANEDTVNSTAGTSTVSDITKTSVSDNSSSSAAIALTQLEISKLNDKQDEIQEEISAKQKELESKQNKIEEKQAELDALVKEAQNNNDNSKLSEITDLQAEIKSLSADIEELISSIEELESDYRANSLTLSSLSNTLESQQTALTQEVSDVNAATTVSEITATDEVSETNAVSQTNQTASKEVKTMAEYKEILDCKFNELWDKFGNAESCIQYMKNNFGTYMDVTGDGRVDKIDLQIFENYIKLSNNLDERKEKGNAYSSARTRFAMELRKQTYISTGVLNDTNSYTLDDIENYAKLGGNVAYLRRNLDITSIAQDSNWRERLLTAGWPEGDLRTNNGQIYKKVSEAQEFIKNNPDKVGYAGIAGAYKFVSEKMEKFSDTWADSTEKYNSWWHRSGDDYYNHMFAVYIQDSAQTDINNDGKFDAKDLEAFSCNVDLDGDGTVSSQESQFLSRVRKAMESKVYRDISTKAVSNNASIDDIITYYGTVGTDADTTKLTSQALSAFEEMKGNPKLYNTDRATGVTGLTGRALLRLLNAIGYAANRSVRLGLQDGTSAILQQGIEDKYYTDDEVTSILTQAINQASPANTYLHYIQSADLSKEELQSILSKINSASSEVQAKLADVKSAVQSKLANME